MSGNPPPPRRNRTVFTAAQLHALRESFNGSKYPNEHDIRNLASSLSLDEFVVKSWFKNQRAKWRKQQQQMQGSRSVDDHVSEPQRSSDVEQPGAAGDSFGDDIEQMTLEDRNPPWASEPYSIEQFVELYALPGEDDPSSLDEYLLPR